MLKEGSRYLLPLTPNQERVLGFIVEELQKHKKGTSPKAMEVSFSLLVNELWERGFLLKTQKDQLLKISKDLIKLLNELP